MAFDALSISDGLIWFVIGSPGNESCLVEYEKLPYAWSTAEQSEKADAITEGKLDGYSWN